MLPAATTSSSDGQYTLCLYPDSSALSEEIVVPPGASWRALSDVAYKYKDAAAASGGVRGIKIRPGLAGESSIGLLAKGLSLPPNLLPAGQTYTIQLRDNAEDLCWSSAFTSGVLKGGQYKAKAP